jgi:hypothetical protein
MAQAVRLYEYQWQQPNGLYEDIPQLPSLVPQWSNQEGSDALYVSTSTQLREVSLINLTLQLPVATTTARA